MDQEKERNGYNALRIVGAGAYTSYILDPHVFRLWLFSFSKCYLTYYYYYYYTKTRGLSYPGGPRLALTARRGACSYTDPVSTPQSSILLRTRHAPLAHVCCSRTHWEDRQKAEQVELTSKREARVGRLHIIVDWPICSAKGKKDHSWGCAACADSVLSVILNWIALQTQFLSHKVIRENRVCSFNR